MTSALKRPTTTADGARPPHADDAAVMAEEFVRVRVLALDDGGDFRGEQAARHDVSRFTASSGMWTQSGRCASS